MECRCIAIHKVGGMFGHPWVRSDLGLGVPATCLSAKCCLLQGVKYTLRATTSRYRWLAYRAEVSCHRWRVLRWNGFSEQRVTTAMPAPLPAGACAAGCRGIVTACSCGWLGAGWVILFFVSATS